MHDHDFNKTLTNRYIAIIFIQPISRQSETWLKFILKPRNHEADTPVQTTLKVEDLHLEDANITIKKDTTKFKI